MSKLTSFSQNLKNAFKGQELGKDLVAGFAAIPYVLLPSYLGWDEWKGFLTGFLTTFFIGAVTGRYEICHAAVGIGAVHLLHSKGADLAGQIGIPNKRFWNFTPSDGGAQGYQLQDSYYPTYYPEDIDRHNMNDSYLSDYASVPQQLADYVPAGYTGQLADLSGIEKRRRNRFSNSRF